MLFVNSLNIFFILLDFCKLSTVLFVLDFIDVEGVTRLVRWQGSSIFLMPEICLTGSLLWLLRHCAQTYSKTKLIKDLTFVPYAWRHYTILYNTAILFVFINLVLEFIYYSLGMFPSVFVFNMYLIVDLYTVSMKLILLISVWVILNLMVLSIKTIKVRKGVTLLMLEYPIIVGFSTLFMFFLISAFNVFGAYIALEGMSLTLYTLSAMNLWSQNSIEAAIKYFCLGALSSGILIYGIGLLFFLAGTLNMWKLQLCLENLIWSYGNLKIFGFWVFFVFFGFWFKISAFPCHFWTPDVYEGSATPITAFFAISVKLAVLTFFLRFIVFELSILCVFWQFYMEVVAVGSIVVGAVGAVFQYKLKRFIGYTSINQIGFVLIGVSSNSLEGMEFAIIYLIIYVVTSLGFFFVVMSFQDENRMVLFVGHFKYLKYLHNRRQFLGGTVLWTTVLLLSMAGIPPFAGFWGKYWLMLSALHSNLYVLVVVSLIFSIVSTFYYIRLVKVIWLEGVVIKNGFEDLRLLFGKNTRLICPLFFLVFILITTFSIFLSYWLDFSYFLVASMIYPLLEL